MALDDVDLADLDRFASGFPHDVSTRLRREAPVWLTFGDGTHFCLGASLARLEIRIVLDALLDRVAAVEPAGPIEWTRSDEHTGVRHMPFRLVRR